MFADYYFNSTQKLQQQIIFFFEWEFLTSDNIWLARPIYNISRLPVLAAIRFVTQLNSKKFEPYKEKILYLHYYIKTRVGKKLNYIYIVESQRKPCDYENKIIVSNYIK